MSPPTTRRPAARNRPSPRPSVQARIATGAQSAEASASASNGAAFDAQDAARELLNTFDELIRNDPSIDDESAALLRQQWEAAVVDAARNPSDDVTFDKAAWAEATEAMRRNGDLNPQEEDALTRQLNDALKPLEQRETKLALEFSRRIRADGEDQALAWLREQQLASLDTEPAAQPMPETGASFGLPGDVIKSKSRRLRGPPKRK